MNELSKNEKHLLESESVSKNIFNELFNPSIDLTIDYSEIYIDDFINNEALKEIPLVKSVVGILKTGVTINQFWFAKKLFTFIQEFNNGTIEDEKFNQFKLQLQTDNKFEKQVAEKLMIFIDRNIEINQTKITANLFRAYVNGDIDYSELSNILTSLNQLHPKLLSSFFEYEKIGFTIGPDDKKHVARNHDIEMMIKHTGFAIETPDFFHGFNLPDEGEKFFKFGLKPLRQ